MNRPDRVPDRQRGGFTLVELLVVIVIIVVLAALSFVVFGKVRDRAAQAKCVNNLKQIGLGLEGFVVDNQHYPDAGAPGGAPHWDRAISLHLVGSVSEEDLDGGVSPFVRGTKEAGYVDGIADIFACDADRFERDSDKYKRSYALSPWTTNLAGSGWVNGPGGNVPRNKGIRQTLLKSPSSAAIACEWHAGTESIANHYGGANHGFHSAGEQGGRDVHGSKQNVLFADGHIETMPTDIDLGEFWEKYHPFGGARNE